MEFTEGKEVFSIDALVVSVREGECAEVKGGLGGSDAATETWLVLINGRKVNTGVSVLPEAAESAFHVTARHPDQIS